MTNALSIVEDKITYVIKQDHCDEKHPMTWFIYKGDDFVATGDEHSALTSIEMYDTLKKWIQYDKNKEVNNEE